jgi:hypothetical protein
MSALRSFVCSIATLCGVCLVFAPVAVEAQVTVVPQSALTPSGTYYTDLIGGGIGNVVVMTGGGNGANLGDPSGRNDDGFSGPIELGYVLRFFGVDYTQFFANNNGNISFGAGISEFIPTGPTGASAPVISPWFADVDTRGAGSGVLHLRNDIANETILTWDAVGYFQEHDDRLDSFQLVVRGAGFAVPAGEGTIGFFYKGMPWEQTDTSVTGAVGFGDGAGNAVVLAGSNTPGLNEVVANHFVWFNQNLQPVPPVSPIPEPRTYALMLAGLVFLAALARRRLRPSLSR